MKLRLLLLLPVSLLAISACDKGEEDGGDGGTGTSTEDTGSDMGTVCSCDDKETVGRCEQAELKDGSNEDFTPYCGPVMAACAASGGTYADAECPVVDELVGTCFDDNTTPDDVDRPVTVTTFYYSLGSMPWDAATAEAACEEDEAFTPAP